MPVSSGLATGLILLSRWRRLARVSKLQRGFARKLWRHGHCYAPGMAMRRLHRAALGCALAGLLIALSGEALACGSWSGCPPPVRLFPYLGTPSHGAVFRPDPVPGNLIYFKLLVDDPGKLTLRTEDGKVIPSSIRTIGGDRVFAPDASVDADLALELEYTTVCPSTLEPWTDVFAFSTFEALTIDLEAPTLEVYEQGVRYPGVDHNDSSFVRLYYRSPSNGAAAVHLLDQHVTVDGFEHVFESVDHGGGYIEFHADCSPEATEVSQIACGRIGQFGTGAHHVVAWSTIVGDPSEPAKAELDVTLKCPPKDAAPEPNGTAGESSVGANDAETPSRALPNAGGGGCSLSRSSPTGPFALLLGVFYGSVVFARRNHSRRARCT
jgi:hypothetical protein